MSSPRPHGLYRHQARQRRREEHHLTDHRVDQRRHGHRPVRRRQRHQPVLRDARRRAAADPAARRARVGRDVRADPARAGRAPPGHRRRPAGARPHRRHRPAARRPADGRRHRGADRAPRPGPAGRGGLLARRRRGAADRGEVPGAGRPARRGLGQHPARRDLPGDARAAGPGQRGRGRVHEGHPDVPALPAGRAAPGGLPAAARQDRRGDGRRTSTSPRRCAACRCRR